uniref:Snurportin-1 n=1 Tax=Rhodosorus marinus TaxID=101924 RepID=A0A7S3EF76_9RHOD|mmetsp:Transcript_31868/g.123672  ORF Transcript_31868/g.123672 Transcript_31868/m.123672 type:complete len:379 (+) Transcript_31868:1582-2718(+)
MQGTTEHGRGSRFKSRGYLSDAAENRRATVLKRQQESRQNINEALRCLQKPPPQGRQLSKFRPWRRPPLSSPEWMNYPPARLGSEWAVAAKCEGKRCVVVAAHGATTIRTRSGRYPRKGGPFTSCLPGGFESEGGKVGTTVLDCIFNPSEPNVLRAIDVMVWNDHMLYDCDFQFRYFWLRGRLVEIGADRDYPVKLTAVEFSTATYEAVTESYEYAKSLPGADGLLFYHWQVHYVLGTTPLILQWKDANCSEYFLEGGQENESQGSRSEEMLDVPHLYTVLLCDSEGMLLTSDVPPVVVSRAEAVSTDRSPAASEGELLRFRVLNTAQLCNVHESEVSEVAQLRIAGKASPVRTLPDSWSRVCVHPWTSSHGDLHFLD